jgi:hypothetical protein
LAQSCLLTAQILQGCQPVQAKFSDISTVLQKMPLFDHIIDLDQGKSVAIVLSFCKRLNKSSDAMQQGATT